MSKDDGRLIFVTYPGGMTYEEMALAYSEICANEPQVMHDPQELGFWFVGRVNSEEYKLWRDQKERMDNHDPI